MSSGLKQRIAGAFVLGALGLVILPLLFDFADPNRIDRNSKLPPAPEIESITVAKAERPAAVGDTPIKAPIFDIERSTPATDKDEKPYGLNNLGLPKGWILQVSSFEEQSSATDFMSKLRKQKYNAFTKRVEVKGKTRYRVYVGPKIDKRRAAADKKKIDKAFKTDAIILHFVP
ncbi:MAG: SPOR domain-containing protein [Porticoccaceae bacterium]|nr:SPOR domain-containing protein [Porticoccaceae bacterium]